MVVEQLFTFYKKPDQFIYAAEHYAKIHFRGKLDDRPVKVIDGLSLYNVNERQLDRMSADLTGKKTGIIFNSAHFIFNIFNFEKLPLREKLRKEIVEWRLKKVFPEDLDQYVHHYFPLKKNRILSILFKRSQMDRIEKAMKQSGLDLIFAGNSTLEVINKIRFLRPSPDFVIEVDPPLAMMIFQEKSCPFYIRKIRSSSQENLAIEIKKTVAFVKSNYEITLGNYAVVSQTEDISAITTSLSQFRLMPLPAKKDNGYYILPR